jgi:hypothetical protein
LAKLMLAKTGIGDGILHLCIIHPSLRQRKVTWLLISQQLFTFYDKSNIQHVITTTSKIKIHIYILILKESGDTFYHVSIYKYTYFVSCKIFYDII